TTCIRFRLPRCGEGVSMAFTRRPQEQNSKKSNFPAPPASARLDGPGRGMSVDGADQGEDCLQLWHNLPNHWSVMVILPRIPTGNAACARQTAVVFVTSTAVPLRQAQEDACRINFFS
ncbi:hypothetical protein, partial [Falsigemmobacter intermedius]